MDPAGRARIEEETGERIATLRAQHAALSSALDLATGKASLGQLVDLNSNLYITCASISLAPQNLSLTSTPVATDPAARPHIQAEVRAKIARAKARMTVLSPAFELAMNKAIGAELLEFQRTRAFLAFLLRTRTYYSGLQFRGVQRQLPQHRCPLSMSLLVPAARPRRRRRSRRRLRGRRCGWGRSCQGFSRWYPGRLPKRCVSSRWST